MNDVMIHQKELCGKAISTILTIINEEQCKIAHTSTECHIKLINTGVV